MTGSTRLEQWPEYKASSLMQSKPSYQQDETLAPEEWRRIYLGEDVEALQMHKQHHVHIMDQHGRYIACTSPF